MESDKLMKIEDVASQIGISNDEIEPYGYYMAKINFMKINTKKVQGKLVLVTAMTPTKYGEGKTTTVIGISQALHSMGQKVSISIREPSMGPCFGVKGGATGGGKATVEPSDRINLLFTGDFPAITAAHNLLSALINNHIFHGNQLKINPEKIVFPRTISAVVIVATIRAMKLHGGNDKSDVEDVDAVKKGFNNLMFHVENIRKFGFEPVVALNRFPDDTENEIDQVETLLKKNSIAYGLSEVFEKGAEGGKEVADLLLKRMPENPISVKYTYSMDQTLTEKIENIGKKIYGAKEVIYTRTAQSNIKKIEKLGYGKLPICMAKTQYSISDDPLKLNAPEDFSITVTSVALSSGAEFVVVYLGSVMTMPGLPKEPASNGIDINENGIITGLF